MLSFFNEPALKIAVRRRVAEHRRLDQIVQGRYWSPDEDNKGYWVGAPRGCFIGCSLHSSNHEAFETHLGLPVWLAYLGERIFEGLSPEEAVEFPLALYDAIPVGADLEPVKDLMFAKRVRSLPESLAVCSVWANANEGFSYKQQRDHLISLLRATKPVEGAEPELPTTPVFQAYYAEVLQEAH